MKTETMSYLIMRVPYDARADAERYVKTIKEHKMLKEGEIPPAVGVEIKQIDPKWVLRGLLADANNPKLEDALREERSKLATQIRKAMEENIMFMLMEVGVDPDALKHTARLNEELLRAVRFLRAENQELQKQLQRAADWEETMALNREAAIKRERINHEN